MTHAHPRHIVAVFALILDPEGRFLLVKHPRRGWGFPGGKVEEGENLIEALKREIKEETGVEAEVGQLAGVYSKPKPPARVFFNFFAKYASGELRTSDESLETRWFDREEALSQVANPAVRDRLIDTLDFGGAPVYRVYSTNPYRIYSQWSI
ncbi:MAG: NUDIX hydrolase [Candidatus Poribacteria bacterium]|nr:NUDIX hydrolase [Candidatus Poribacteria bacterium]